MSKKNKNNDEEMDVSNICDKPIELSSGEEEEDVGYNELMNEIHKMQVKDNEKQIFDDFDELFDTHSVCFVPEKNKNKFDTENEEKLDNILNPSQILQKKSKGFKNKDYSFTDLSIIQNEGHQSKNKYK